MKNFKIIAIAYCTLLLLAAYPFSPLKINFDCEKLKRADFVFPARQIQCWLDYDLASEGTND